MDIIRVCADSHIEGYKKGAYFVEKKRKDIIGIFDREFGKDLNKRLGKLKEETGELLQAISEYESGLDGIESVKDEMSDVLAVLTHVSSLLGIDTMELLENSLDKVIKRKKNPNYKRKHPHVGN